MPRNSRTSFNSSQLVRLLAGLDIADVADSQQTLAERLSQWVDWTDAVSLSDALATAPAAAPARPRPEPGGRSAVADEAARLRASLARDITTDPRLGGSGGAAAQRQMHAAAPAAPASVDREGLQACYLAHQQAMQSAIAPLRQRLRKVLAAFSDALAQLAALDAALERALAARERQLLASVPLLLDRGSVRARADAQASSGAASVHGGADTAALGQTMQQLLLAELEIRMQAVDGMIAALSEETATS